MGEQGYDILLWVAGDSDEFAQSAQAAIEEIFEQSGNQRCSGYLCIGVNTQGDERTRLVDPALESIWTLVES
jgi:hypothetical protein